MSDWFLPTSERPWTDGNAVDVLVHGATYFARVVEVVSKTGDGRYRATATVIQSQFGIKPYSGMLGALKLRDDVEVEVTVDLSTAPGGPS